MRRLSPLRSERALLRRRRHDRAQELLKAALDLFADQGFAGARSEDIAALAGVSKGTLYLYFSSKEAMFQEVVRSQLLALLGEGERIVASFESWPLHSLRRRVRAGIKT